MPRSDDQNTEMEVFAKLANPDVVEFPGGYVSPVRPGSRATVVGEQERQQQQQQQRQAYRQASESPLDELSVVAASPPPLRSMRKPDGTIAAMSLHMSPLPPPLQTPGGMAFPTSQSVRKTGGHSPQVNVAKPIPTSARKEASPVSLASPVSSPSSSASHGQHKQGWELTTIQQQHQQQPGRSRVAGRVPMLPTRATSAVPQGIMGGPTPTAVASAAGPSSPFTRPLVQSLGNSGSVMVDPSQPQQHAVALANSTFTPKPQAQPLGTAGGQNAEQKKQQTPTDAEDILLPHPPPTEAPGIVEPKADNLYNPVGFSETYGLVGQTGGVDDDATAAAAGFYYDDIPPDAIPVYDHNGTLVAYDVPMRDEDKGHPAENGSAGQPLQQHDVSAAHYTSSSYGPGNNAAGYQKQYREQVVDFNGNHGDDHDNEPLNIDYGDDPYTFATSYPTDDPSSAVVAAATAAAAAATAARVSASPQSSPRARVTAAIATGGEQQQQRQRRSSAVSSAPTTPLPQRVASPRPAERSPTPSSSPPPSTARAAAPPGAAVVVQSPTRTGASASPTRNVDARSFSHKKASPLRRSQEDFLREQQEHMLYIIQLRELCERNGQRTLREYTLDNSTLAEVQMAYKTMEMHITLDRDVREEFRPYLFGAFLGIEKLNKHIGRPLKLDGLAAHVQEKEDRFDRSLKELYKKHFQYRGRGAPEVELLKDIGKTVALYHLKHYTTSFFGGSDRPAAPPSAANVPLAAPPMPQPPSQPQAPHAAAPPVHTSPSSVPSTSGGGVGGAWASAATAPSPAATSMTTPTAGAAITSPVAGARIEAFVPPALTLADLSDDD